MFTLRTSIAAPKHDLREHKFFTLALFWAEISPSGTQDPPEKYDVDDQTGSPPIGMRGIRRWVLMDIRKILLLFGMQNRHIGRKLRMPLFRKINNQGIDRKCRIV